MSREQASRRAPSPRLLTLEVAPGPHPANQEQVLEFLRPHFARAAFDVARVESVFHGGGIEERCFALPLEAYQGLDGSAQRQAIFSEVADSLLTSAADAAVSAELRDRVTHVVMVCSSGVATPSLECAVMTRLGIAPAARRVPVFGLGCAGGVAGLQVARDLASSSAEALVLLLVVELTSLTWLARDLSQKNFVACSLFGDGAAAALVGASEGEASRRLAGLASIGSSASRLFAETEDLMGWNVRDDGWEVVFSPRIPGVVRREVHGLVDPLAPSGGFRHFALHPGGRKILEAYQEALSLEAEDLVHASEVLRRFGNMSAATVLFVLHRLLSTEGHGLREGTILSTAFGPGFSAEALRLEAGPGVLEAME